MSRQRVTLRIDRIQVEGAQISRTALAEAIVDALQQSLSAPGGLEGLRQAGYVPRIDGGELRSKRTGAADLGQAIAQATFGAIRR